METRKCKKCGRELPIDNFRKNYLATDGYVAVCNACQNKCRVAKKNKAIDEITPPQSNGGNPELSKFTPRELMAELKIRGFRGKLSIVKEVVL